METIQIRDNNKDYGSKQENEQVTCPCSYSAENVIFDEDWEAFVKHRLSPEFEVSNYIYYLC